VFISTAVHEIADSYVPVTIQHVKEMREAKWEGKVYFPTFVIRNKGIH
jgi:hypothetical protein